MIIKVTKKRMINKIIVRTKSIKINSNKKTQTKFICELIYRYKFCNSGGEHNLSYFFS